MSFKTTLRDILETLVSILVTLPLLPFLLIIFLVIIIVRLAVSLYLAIAYRNGMLTLMSPVDSSWAFETDSSMSTSHGLYIIEGDCPLERIRENTKTCVESDVVGGKMSRKIRSVFGFPCWEVIKEDDMDMKEYVKVILDDVELGYPANEEDLFNLMSIHDKPSWPNSDKAPWELLVIPRFAYKHPNSNDKKSQNHYAVVYKMHHGIMDGISTGNVLHAVLADRDKPFKFSVDPTTIQKSSLLYTTVIYFLALLSMPRVFIKNSLMVDKWQSLDRKSSPPELTGPKTFTWSRTLRMEALKQVKTNTSTSVYSVVLSSIAGAFKRLNDNANAATKGQLFSPIHRDFHVLATVALLPYPDRKPRNRVSGMIIPTSIGQDLSPTERLRVNHSNLIDVGRYSSAVLAVSNSFYPKLTGILPYFMNRPLGLPMHLKLTLSNVPGPLEDVWIYGDKIRDMAIWLPIKYTIGLGVGVFSYGDRVRVSFVGDKAYYPNEKDLQSLKDAFEEELAELGKEVGISEVFL